MSSSPIQSAKMSSRASGPAVPASPTASQLPSVDSRTRGQDEQRHLPGISAGSQATSPGVIQQRAPCAGTVLWGRPQICDCSWLLTGEETLSEESSFSIWTRNEGPFLGFSSVFYFCQTCHLTEFISSLFYIKFEFGEFLY